MWLNSLRSTNEVSWSHAEQLITNQLINIYADVAQLAEQLICNQQVIGSSPIIGFLGEFPSGQRGQTVNLLATLSKVRILLHPSKGSDICLDLFLLYYKAAAPSSARGCRPGQADKIIRFAFC